MVSKLSEEVAHLKRGISELKGQIKQPPEA
jgi:hypothetical protein